MRLAHLVGEECWNRQRECDEVRTSCMRRTLEQVERDEVSTSCVWRMLDQRSTHLDVKNTETGRIWGSHILCVKNTETGRVWWGYHTWCVKNAKIHRSTHLAQEECWNRQNLTLPHIVYEQCPKRQNLRLHRACEECWNTCEHILQVKDAETGRIWDYTLRVKSAETLVNTSDMWRMPKQAESEVTAPCVWRMLKQAELAVTTPCWNRQNLRLPHPVMWKMLKQAESEVTTRHTFQVKNIETGRFWNYPTLCLKNAGKPRSTNVACEECLTLNRLNLRSPCLFFALARERTFTKTCTLNVGVLQDQKIYCLQACPCIFQPGNFTGWAVKGLMQESFWWRLCSVRCRLHAWHFCVKGLLPIKFKPSQLSLHPPPHPAQLLPPPNWQ